eukprot:scaffold32983_cov66-Phaeocystis_antarctica.AAC.2
MRSSLRSGPVAVSRPSSLPCCRRMRRTSMVAGRRRETRASANLERRPGRFGISSTARWIWGRRAGFACPKRWFEHSM